jgi:hypothetical protein
LEKTCSKCGAPFGCKSETGGCWCEDIKLDPLTLDKLKQDFENCLCPKCLKEFELVAGQDTSGAGLQV